MGLNGLPYRIGLKLHSTNLDLLPIADQMKQEYFGFIELYIIPGSLINTVGFWKTLDIPFVIHAPHSFDGVNLAQSALRISNQEHMREAQIFADKLKSDIIIVHGGNNGFLEETIFQIKRLDDKRIALENKPRIGMFDESCVGWSPKEFSQVDQAGCLHGTVLDFVHAACAAHSSGLDVSEIIGEFVSFHPKVFHLSDGYSSSAKDIHLNLGKGNMNLFEYLKKIPENGLITIETPRDARRKLDDFIMDIEVLRKIVRDRLSEDKR